jgi:hypothetical protein
MAPDAAVVRCAGEAVDDVELAFGDDDPPEGGIKVAAMGRLKHLPDGVVDEVGNVFHLALLVSREWNEGRDFIASGSA